MTKETCRQSFAAIIDRIRNFMTPKRAYPAFDKIVVLYAAIVIVVQTLFQISPMVTLFASMHLANLQTYLGILGGVLLAVDFFTTKSFCRGAYSVFLYGILIMAMLSSVRMIEYGLTENIYKLCWMLLQFALFYPCAQRIDHKHQKKYLKILYSIVLAVWLVACCVSLYQYVLQIRYAYVVNPLAQDASTIRQGFFDNRLFGVFYTLNHAVFTSLLLFLIGIVYMIRARHWYSRVLLGVSEYVLLCHIILSGSRSGMIALMISLFCLTILYLRNKIDKKRGWYRALVSVAVAALVVAIVFVLLMLMKQALSHVPRLVSECLDLPTVQHDLLDRDIGEDYSNGRLSIWMDYIRLSGEIGPIGLSPGNYMPYVFENHQDLYIVDFIARYYPDKYASGIIYHVHSGYLMVYVSAGWIGFASLAVFAFLCLRRVLWKLHIVQKAPYRIIGPFMLVATVAVSAVFDEGIFFQNNPQTTIFWLALGLLMKECAWNMPKNDSLTQQDK